MVITVAFDAVELCPACGICAAALRRAVALEAQLPAGNKRGMVVERLYRFWLGRQLAGICSAVARLTGNRTVSPVAEFGVVKPSGVDRYRLHFQAIGLGRHLMALDALQSQVFLRRL